jgi:D-methionine transport system substrate-binding protein
MQRRRIGILAVIIIIIAIIIGFVFHQKKTATSTITLGSQGTDTAVWQHIAKTENAKKLGLKIKVQDFTDSAAANRATAEGKLDANAFQSYAYYLTYNNGNKKKIAALGTTYIQPMGLYSKTAKKVSAIPNNGTVAIANDPAAESRGLKLLESAGLITLSKHSISDLVTPKDVVKNPKHLTLKPILSTSAPSALKDKSIAAVVIDNNTAQEAHLNVFKDAIYHENLNQNTKANVNVIVTAKKNANNKTYQKLVKLYHEKAIQKYVKKHYPAKVEVNKPLSYLND